MWAIYEDGNPQRIQWQEHKRACYDKFIQYAARPIERVELPYKDKKIQAILHLPPGRKTGEKVPCVMYIPGMDGVKEDNPASGDPFIEKGFAVLAIDGPGQGETREGGICCTASNYADAGKLAVDYLVQRPEIDAERFGVMASSMGSYWAPRVVAEEKRFKACAVSGVCMEPGQYAIFNMSSPTFKLNYMYMSGYDDEAAFDDFCKTLSLRGVTAKITCPYMVAAGEDDEHCDMKFVYDLMGEIPAPKLLYVFEGERHSIRNPKARPLVVNWLIDTLLGKPFKSEIVRIDTQGGEERREWPRS
jgi:dipeptidyl aminopeptidase/acylaminoacyl peptidase